jgi:uncharacterized protein YdaU (DUF1376 family)
MSEYPFFPVFVDTYLADTHPDLELEEHGCYLLLMFFAWLRPCKTLPDDDAWIAARLGIHALKWKSLRPRVLERFWIREIDRDGEPRWYQKKQRKVAGTASERRQKAREAASVSASVRASRKSKINGLGSANAQASAQASIPYQSNINSTSSNGAARAALQPDGGAASPASRDRFGGRLKPGTFKVAVDTPQWQAWTAYLGKPAPIVNLAWHFESEWPPTTLEPEEHGTKPQA